ncbi:hypothetical protein AMTRI_Chr07g25820 [Amborella trichopoda]
MPLWLSMNLDCFVHILSHMVGCRFCWFCQMDGEANAITFFEKPDFKYGRYLSGVSLEKLPIENNSSLTLSSGKWELGSGTFCHRVKPVQSRHVYWCLMKQQLLSTRPQTT